MGSNSEICVYFFGVSFQIKCHLSRQDVDPELVMSLTLLLRNTPVGRVSIEIYITELLMVLIIVKRSIIPRELSVSIHIHLNACMADAALSQKYAI